MERQGSHSWQLSADSSSQEQQHATSSSSSQEWQDEARALPPLQYNNLYQAYTSYPQNPYDSHSEQNQLHQMQLSLNSQYRQVHPGQIWSPANNSYRQVRSQRRFVRSQLEIQQPHLTRPQSHNGVFVRVPCVRPIQEPVSNPLQFYNNVFLLGQQSASSVSLPHYAASGQQTKSYDRSEYPENSQNFHGQEVLATTKYQQKIHFHQETQYRQQRRQQRQYSKHQQMSHNSPQSQQEIWKSEHLQQPRQYSQQQRTGTSQYQPQQASETDTTTCVLTNMFEIIFDEKFATSAVHYDVTIEPIASKALYRKVFEECRRKHFKNSYPAFDGKKNAYSATELPYVHETEIKIQYEICDKQCDDGQCDEQCDKFKINKTFRITLKKVAEIDFGWIKNLPFSEPNTDQNKGIQALDIIIRHGPESRLTNVGQSLFWDLNKKTNQSNWNQLNYLKILRGGFLSAILGSNNKIYLNVDVIYKGFLKVGKVNELINQLKSETSNQNELNEKITLLNNLRVMYEILPNNGFQKTRKIRIRRINGIGRSANEQTFKYKESEITVRNYFEEQKNYILKCPDLPCLVVKNTIKDDDKDNKGKTTETYLPAELCTIVKGQPIKKLDSNQTTKMINEAVTKPSERKNRILTAFKKIDVNNSLTMKEEFHLSVRTQMKEVKATILAAPKLQYNQLVNVQGGTWKMRNLKFNEGASLEKHMWTVLIFNKYDSMTQELARNFVKNLINKGCQLGMRIENPDIRQIKQLNKKQEIQNYFQQNKELKLIIVIMPKNTNLTGFTSLIDIYSEIKQMTERDAGVLTQCLKFNTFRTAAENFIQNSQVITNILLKINAKLNGINHILEESSKYLKENCMIIGADVTHPSPHVNTPSIAAVTASSDTFGFQYNVMYKLQNSREEMISGLEEIITSQLSVYKKKTKCYPSSIIYYRDGVSDGQFLQVLDIEINAIRNATRSLKNFSITCLVVQKRHHVRFFPTTGKNDDNVLAGTIVDTEIVPHTSNKIDFYLVSHKNNRGTTRPTKYTCILNESGYTVNEIEKLTYNLCHMCTRCARAISYPAPTYYAHLAANRAKALIRGITFTSDFNITQRNLDNIRFFSDEYPMYFV